MVDSGSEGSNGQKESKIEKCPRQTGTNERCGSLHQTKWWTQGHCPEKNGPSNRSPSLATADGTSQLRSFTPSMLTTAPVSTTGTAVGRDLHDVPRENSGPLDERRLEWGRQKCMFFWAFNLFNLLQFHVSA